MTDPPGAGEPPFRLIAKPCPDCLGTGRWHYKTAWSPWIICGRCWGAGEVEVQRGR